MKRIAILIFVHLLLVMPGAFSQISWIVQWDRRYGGTNQELPQTIQQTFDGGYILSGLSLSGIGGDKSQPNWDPAEIKSDGWVIKLDSLGVKEWDKRFGGTDDDWLYFVQQTTDHGYILGGSAKSGLNGDKSQANWDPTNNTHDYWVVKIDSLGNMQWNKRFGGSGTDLLQALQQTSDGGYILGGQSNSAISGNKTQAAWGGSADFWIVKIDAAGITQWDKRFGGTSSEILRSLQQTSDGGYILGGWSASGISGDKSQASQGSQDFWIVKTDGLGNKLWDKRFGGTNTEDLFSVLQTVDGGYILGGLSRSGIGGDKTQASWGGSYDYWIVKTDALGNKLWDKRFGGSDDESDFGNIFITSDGGFLLSGTSRSGISGDKTENNLGPWQTWLVQTDSLGNLIWDKTIFVNDYNQDCYAIQTFDGSYVVANRNGGSIGGYKTQNPQGANDFWIVKFNEVTPPLPVELISFKADWFNTHIKLEWITASEINNRGFELQRAVLSDNFETIAWIEGSGNSSVVQRYGSDDYKIEQNKTYYYRLKQIDFDGAFEYSNIISVKIGSNDFVINIYPNPHSEFATISYSLSENSNVEIEIVNMLGQQVAVLYSGNQKQGYYEYKFNAAEKGFGAGIFFVRAIVNDKIYVAKLATQK